MLRIALFGQAGFGKDTLHGLLDSGHKVVGVFAPPEGKRPDALAERAAELGLPLIRRRYYRRKNGEAIPAAVEAHRELGADLNVLASVQVFLPPEIVDAPRHKSLCFHPSLLPAYRGGAAMQWQIIDAVHETGVSIFVPDTGADTGPVVVQRGGVEIGPTDTTATLFFQKLYPLGVAAMLEAVDLVDSGTAAPKAQDESRASHQGLVGDTVGAIDLTKNAAIIDRLVRGCDPQPGAWLTIGEQPKVRLYDAELSLATSGAATGSIVTIDDAGLHIALDGGTLRIGRVRADGGKEGAAEFASRMGLEVGQSLAP